MLKLNLPPCDIKIKKTENGILLFDKLRSKYVAFTPEEWVRQNFVHFLIAEKQYPAGLILNEMQIKLHKSVKRCDSVVYNKDLKPLAIVEYKAPRIRITQSTFEQIARYNYVLHVPCLIMSNGINHYACRIDYRHCRIHYLRDIPSYEELSEMDTT